MTFTVEVVLKGRDFAVTEAASVDGDPASWDETAVREVLVQILRTIERAENPRAPVDRRVALRGFSWIVEPNGEASDAVVIVIEIPMGAAVAGPFPIAQAALTAMITRVLHVEREPIAPETVH